MKDYSLKKQMQESEAPAPQMDRGETLPTNNAYLKQLKELGTQSQTETENNLLRQALIMFGENCERLMKGSNQSLTEINQVLVSQVEILERLETMNTKFIASLESVLTDMTDKN